MLVRAGPWGERCGCLQVNFGEQAGCDLMVTCVPVDGQENIRLQNARRFGWIPWHAWDMPISARNQLEGKIAEVTLGDIMAHVVVKIGKNRIESVITRRSAEELALKKGDTVTVVIKSTEVMLQKG
jgi:molybdopterin-binding protein